MAPWGFVQIQGKVELLKTRPSSVPRTLSMNTVVTVKIGNICVWTRANENPEREREREKQS